MFSFAPVWGCFCPVYDPRLAPLPRAQGKPWAAFCRRFAAGDGSNCTSASDIKL